MKKILALVTLGLILGMTCSQGAWDPFRSVKRKIGEDQAARSSTKDFDTKRKEALKKEKEDIAAAKEEAEADIALIKQEAQEQIAERKEKLTKEIQDIKARSKGQDDERKKLRETARKKYRDETELSDIEQEDAKLKTRQEKLQTRLKSWRDQHQSD